jgi:hypothetical protein
MNGWITAESGHSSQLNDLTNVLRRSVEIAAISGHLLSMYLTPIITELNCIIG